MSEMVERVARAIGNCSEDDERWLSMKINLEKMARAAIEAMRLPTQDMSNAGDRDITIMGYTRTFTSDDQYRAMIDEALKE